MKFWLTLFIAIASINILHYIVYSTLRYTRPFIATLWFKYILCHKDYVYVAQKYNYEDKTQKERDLEMMRYVCSIVFWNIFIIMGVLAYPLSLARYIALTLFVLLFHGIGLIRAFEEEGINEQYRKYDVDKQYKDYEKRNVILANAIVLLEKENMRLKRANGEPINDVKVKKIKNYVIV